MFTLKTAELEDLPALAELSAKTFMDTYAAHDERENNLAYVREMLNEGKWRELWEKPDHTIFLLHAGEALVGFACVNSVPPPPLLAGKKVMQILRIYVAQTLHGRGAGKILMDKCKETALETDCEGLWLVVWRENHKAFRFYERAGFRHIGEHIFRALEKEYHDCLMFFPFFFEL